MSTPPLAEAFPVGELLADELEARGWTRVQFAEILGRPVQTVSEILSGKKEISRRTAAQIATALGTTPELWLSLQDTYHLWQQAQSERVRADLDDVRLRARLSELAPVAVLRQRGYLRSSQPRAQAAELAALYGVHDVSADPDLLVAARRSNTTDTLTSTQMAWVACVRADARAVPVRAHSPQLLEALATRLALDLGDAERWDDLPERLAEVGVRLVYVEAFPSSRIDGCALLVDGFPTIGLSGRGRRLDKVLFTLLHEIAHVVLGHVSEDELILDEDSSPSTDVEREANEQAAAWILPRPLPPVPDRVDAAWIAQAAEATGVAPIVVIGRLQNEGTLSWRSSLVRDAPQVVDQLRAWRSGPSAVENAS